MAFSLFAESFLDGFTFPGVFSRARRPGAPTQVFPDEPIQVFTEPGEVALADVTISKASDYVQKGRDIIARHAATVEKAVDRSAHVLRDKEGRTYEVAKPAYERDEPSERKSER